MEKILNAFGHVDKDGRLVIYNRDLFIGAVKEHFKEMSIEFIIKERPYKLSDKLRSYYFAVVVKQIQSAYRSIGEIKSMHDIDYEMRDRFLYYEEFNEETGEFEKYLHTLRRDETKVSQKMMLAYIEDCIRWTAINLEWAIPFQSEEFTENDMTEHQQNIQSIKRILRQTADNYIKEV